MVKPVVLIILDGWGVAPDSPGNAIARSRKPFWDKISATYPHTSLLASGDAVGLPTGEAGNSEVGHLNIGAGMVVYQELERINMAISDGSFLKNGAFLSAVKHAQKNNSNLHLMGLVGPGSVHSDLEHLYALLWLVKTTGLHDVFLQAFTDGRDSSPTAGLEIIHDIVTKFLEIGVGKLASICGRYFAMDRDNHWKRTKKAYDLLVSGIGDKIQDPLEAINRLYQKGTTDEFIEPLLITGKDGKIFNIKDGDAVIFFNFRPDRARQLTEAFVLPAFDGFARKRRLENLAFVTMTEYEKGLPVSTAFPPPTIDYPLAAILSAEGKRQLHIGETEKYAHVTYFLNGGREDPYPGEDRVHIPSPKVATYDQKPEMAALEITDHVCKVISENIYDCIIVNFANADMVAHTGSFEATKKAIETLDRCLEKICKLVLSVGGVTLITGDHGKAEEMINLVTGGVDTEHSANPVPFIAVGGFFPKNQDLELTVGSLADIAPTLLSLLRIHKPDSMTGNDLLE